MNYLNFQRFLRVEESIPIHLITIGTNDQPYINRPVGLPYHQIFLTINGTGVFRLFGVGDIKLQPGDVIIITAGTSHEYFPLSKKTWELGYVGFKGSLAEVLLNELNFKNYKKIKVHSFSAIFKTIEQLWIIAKKEQKNSQWHASKHLYSLLLELKKSSDTSSNKASTHFSNPHIHKVAEFIHKNYQKNLKIDSLAAMSGYSTHHFSRLFRKIYGMNPSQYLNQIRLERAKFLLEEKDGFTITEISNQVGIEVNYFIRLFKKKYGMTPGKYRLSISHTHSR